MALKKGTASVKMAREDRENDITSDIGTGRDTVCAVHAESRL
jgi:hypothetical protein